MRLRLELPLGGLFGLLFVFNPPLRAEEKIMALSTFGDRTTVALIAESAPSISDPIVGARTFIRQHAQALKVPRSFDSLEVKSLTTDSLQTSHVRYRQQLGGLPVWGAELSVHIDRDGKVTSATGSLSELGQLDVRPRLSESQAAAQAQAAWISEFGDDDGAFKSARLFVVDQSLLDKNVSAKLHLAWEVRLVSSFASRSYKYLVDAHSGEVLAKLPQIASLNRIVVDCSAGGTAGVGTGDCYLNQNIFGYIFGRSEGQPDRGQNPIYNTDRLDTDFIYYRVGVAHNYFLSQFGRDGANFLGGIGTSGGSSQFTPAASYAGDGTNAPQFGISFCPNANWDPDRERLSFCKGMPTMDIVGHEYTHAITHFSVVDEFGAPSGFVFQNDAGALSEGFSDVFGEAAERWAYGSNDWMMGSSQNVTTPIMRNIANPESMNLPSTTYSPFYFCGTNDDGGIHTNNVVLAHAAYRLANGGELSGCSISGLGPQKQEAIFYRALSTYFSPTSNFAAAYTALINACADLFGGASAECLQTTRTLNAVMMNQPGRCSGVPAVAPDCLDPSDLCPTNPNKRAPGICGCVDEIDADGNGAFDCLPAAEFRADMAVLLKQISKLTVMPTDKKKKKKQKAVRSEVTRLLIELGDAVASSESQIQLTSSDLSLSSLYDAVKKTTKASMKAGSRDFSKAKSKARKSASKLIANLA